MLSLGYDLLTRRSELVALRTDDIQAREDGTLRVLIRRGKADPSGLGRVAFTSRRSAAHVRAWLAWRGMDIHPLFCPIYHETAIDRDLSTTTVMRIIKTAARDAGLDPDEVGDFSGHSLRVGAAQDLLRGSRHGGDHARWRLEIGQRADAVPGERGAQCLGVARSGMVDQFFWIARPPSEMASRSVRGANLDIHTEASLDHSRANRPR